MQSTRSRVWGVKLSPSTVSELNQKIVAQIEGWCNQPIQGRHAYVYLDGLWRKRSWGDTVKNVSVLVAVGSTKMASARSSG